MHGGVDWGGDTRWSWDNALALCRGTHRADALIACFERKVGAGTGWREATRACGAALRAGRGGRGTLVRPFSGPQPGDGLGRGA